MYFEEFNNALGSDNLSSLSTKISMCRSFNNSTTLGNTSNPQTRFILLLLLFHSDTFWVPFLAVCDLWRRNAMTKKCRARAPTGCDCAASVSSWRFGYWVTEVGERIVSACGNCTPKRLSIVDNENGGEMVGGRRMLKYH